MFDLYDNDFEKAFDEAVDAIEKKEHRLIWADALKRHYAWWKGGTREMTMDEAKNDFDTIIDLQPTVEVEPTKHGRWLRTDAYPHRIYCSECYATFIRNDEFLKLNDIPHDYCPNCGADMRGGENG